VQSSIFLEKLTDFCYTELKGASKYSSLPSSPPFFRLAALSSPYVAGLRFGSSALPDEKIAGESDNVEYLEAPLIKLSRQEGFLWLKW